MGAETLNEAKADNYFLLAASLGSFGFIIFSFAGLYIFGILGIALAQILVPIFTFSSAIKQRNMVPRIKQDLFSESLIVSSFPFG